MSDSLAWREALQSSLGAATQQLVSRIVVLDATASTQDECRRFAEGRPGCLVTARRQTAGRGRLGRHWADDRGQGAALTLSVAAQTPERLSIASAVAVCEGLEPFAGGQLGLRWPNDIIADGRKLAGILIEQLDLIALIGVGVNVNQTDWPTELAGIAISLRQLIGTEVDRIDVIAQLIQGLGVNLARSDDEISDAFARRDLLTGTMQTFTIGHERITGIVERIDPLTGILVRTNDGARALPTSATSLVKPHPHS